MAIARTHARTYDTGDAPHDPPLATGAADEAHHCPRTARKWVLVVAVLASALGFIDSSVVSIAIPAIRASLGASLEAAQWVQNAYLLALSALILVGGAAGDRFGVRRTFLWGIVLFALASILCAVAWSPSSLIVARGLKGAAAAFTVPLSLALIAKNYPAKERGRAIGIWAAASGITTAIGPLLGGWLLSAGGDEAWRWLFWINPPAALLAVFLLLRVPADVPRDGDGLDWRGAALAVGALGLLAYGLTALGEGGAGSTIGVAAPTALLAGTAGAALFVWWEGRASNPMVELSLFRSRAFVGANLLTFLIYFALGGVLFFLPMALVAGWGLSAAAVGTVFLPFTAVMAVVSGFAGDYAGRHGPRAPITLGATTVALAFAWLAWRADVHSLAWTVYPAMTVLGLGMGMAVSPLSTAIMGAVDDGHSGEASGINNAVSRMAGLFAVAALGVLVAAVFEGAGAGAGASVPALPPGTSFGDPSASGAPGFAAASDAAFAALCWACAALCLAGAAVAWTTQQGR